MIDSICFGVYWYQCVMESSDQRDHGMNVINNKAKTAPAMDEILRGRFIFISKAFKRIGVWGKNQNSRVLVNALVIVRSVL